MTRKLGLDLALLSWPSSRLVEAVSERIVMKKAERISILERQESVIGCQLLTRRGSWQRKKRPARRRRNLIKSKDPDSPPSRRRPAEIMLVSLRLSGPVLGSLIVLSSLWAADDPAPVGLKKRVPLTTSRVVGSPEP